MKSSVSYARMRLSSGCYLIDRGFIMRTEQIRSIDVVRTKPLLQGELDFHFWICGAFLVESMRLQFARLLTVAYPEQSLKHVFSAI